MQALLFELYQAKALLSSKERQPAPVGDASMVKIASRLLEPNSEIDELEVRRKVCDWVPAIENTPP